MDECSDERMAPALHATNTGDGNENLTRSYQLLPTPLASVLSSTDQVYQHSGFDSAVFQQMNGGQTICDSPVTDGLKAAEPSLVKKVGLHESKCILEHGSQHAPDTGESGRYLSSVSSVSVDSETEGHASKCDPCNDAEPGEHFANTNKSNGWSPVHKNEASLHQSHGECAPLSADKSQHVAPLNGNHSDEKVYRHENHKLQLTEAPPKIATFDRTTSAAIAEQEHLSKNPLPSERLTNRKNTEVSSESNAAKGESSASPYELEVARSPCTTRLPDSSSDCGESLDPQTLNQTTLQSTKTGVTAECHSVISEIDPSSSPAAEAANIGISMRVDPSEKDQPFSQTPPNSLDFISDEDRDKQAASCVSAEVDADCVLLLRQMCDRISSESATDETSASATIRSTTTTNLESTHCVQRADFTEKNGKTASNDDSDVSSNLNFENMMGLAHGLITGKHMQTLPLKLTNTIQELAASLASGLDGSGSQPAKEKDDGCPRRRNLSSAKSLNFEDETALSKISNASEIKARHKMQWNDVSETQRVLDKRVMTLQSQLNKIRASFLIRNVRKQLNDVRRYAKDANESSSDAKADYVSDQTSRSFWKKVLERNSIRPSESTVSCESELRTDSHRHGDIKNSHKRLQRLAASSAGIIKKELKCIQRACDPDLTESSSDEESTEYVYRAGEGYVPDRKKTDPSIENKIFTDAAKLAWGEQRLAIAKRWTWLQAQVSDLEYKIRQYNELYRQVRTAKGEVVLGFQTGKNTTTDIEHVVGSAVSQSPSGEPASTVGRAVSPSADCASPCSVTQMMRNVNKQTTNLLDNWSPLSAGVPSPLVPTAASEQASESTKKSAPVETADKTCVAARTRPLLYPVRRRKLIRLTEFVESHHKMLKPPAARHESAIMRDDFSRHTPFQRADGRHVDFAPASMSLRAAAHDHSYHRVLSHPQDIPLSLRVSSYMQGCHKWNSLKVPKRERRYEKRSKRKQKNSSKSRSEILTEKIKTRSKSATVVLERMKSNTAAVSRVNSADAALLEQQRRRGSASAFSDNVKRSRVNSIDSDSEYHRSGTSTPTLDTNPQMQAFLKRKRQADQAYDINNIVIPHGLTTTRIEKLQYKEILTPGWRIVGEEASGQVDESAVDQTENMADAEFQVRHDRYEILEKKKYMAYMEWGLNKKNGTRSMGRANLPSTLDEVTSPTFFYPPSLRSSPTPGIASSDPASPASPEPVYNPGLAAGIQTRRGSSDVFQQAGAPPPDAAPSSAATAPSTSSYLGPAPIRPTSAGTQEAAASSSWERRSFPLSDAAHEELLKKPTVAKEQHADDLGVGPRFRPISRQSSVDTNTAPRHKPPKAVSTPDVHGQPARKRQRTDSQLSSLSRDDDRHSDGSVSSSYSAKMATRARKDGGQLRSRQASRPHKPSFKDDFYFYSELDSDGSDSDEDEPDISDEDPILAREDSSRWESRPVALPDKKAPVVFLYKKK